MPTKSIPGRIVWAVEMLDIQASDQVLEIGCGHCLAASLADADFGRQRFSKVFAINVNLFWIDPTKELHVVKRLLRPEGALYIFYQPLGPAQLKPLAKKVSRNLEAGSFVVDGAIIGKGLPVASLCVIARATSESA